MVYSCIEISRSCKLPSVVGRYYCWQILLADDIVQYVSAQCLVILWHGLLTRGVLCLTTKYSTYCRKQITNLTLRNHIFPSTVVNRKEDLDFLTTLLTVLSVHVFCTLPSESLLTTSGETVFLEAENLNHQHLSCWNIAIIASTKGSSELIMEARNWKYASVPCLVMWGEILVFY